ASCSMERKGMRANSGWWTGERAGYRTLRKSWSSMRGPRGGEPSNTNEDVEIEVSLQSAPRLYPGCATRTLWTSLFPRRMRVRRYLVLPFLCIVSLQAGAQNRGAVESFAALASLVQSKASEVASVVERFTADQTSLNRRYDAEDSPAQRTRMREFYGAWRTRLLELDFDKLTQEGRVDYVLLDNYLVHQLALLDRANKLS